VLLDDVLDLLLLKVLELVFLEIYANLSTATKWLVDSVRYDGEGTTSSRLPDVLLVIVVLGDDLDMLGHEVGRVEADIELTNHRNISARAESLYEAL
jgi:hypothetical protein